MKAHYDKDEDILMLVLSNKKIDDSYETDFGYVEISEDKEPVIIEVFKASKFLKDLARVIPKNIQKQVWQNQTSSAAIPHRIK